MATPDHITTAVVDTNVISFFLKYPRDTRCGFYEKHLSSHSLLVIAAQTKAELELWSLQHNWGLKRVELMHRLTTQYVFAEATADIAITWASVKYQKQRVGRTIDTADAWIAATAVYFRIPLITHNAKDFTDIKGLSVITENANS